jgi:hypothetical protein
MFSAKFVKKEGKLTYKTEKESLAYKNFIDQIQEGEEVDMFLSIPGKGGSYAQISKIHACVREMAKESGYTFEEMKKLVKKQAGLCYAVNDEGKQLEMCKSFAECSNDELSQAIQACIEIGLEYNINLA